LYWSGASWVCINTQRPNAVVAEAIAAGDIPALRNYAQLRREVPYGSHERVDVLLSSEGRPPCYVEVKSCTL
ncbi:DNA/RNA nuclease SfsA, partial [Acidithiobacillus ferrooxidans]|nr:DNA/RNA nuclease SfsA [Acidithiobacillus ferrooxidans]